MKKQFVISNGKVILGDNLEILNNTESSEKIIIEGKIQYLEEKIEYNKNVKDLIKKDLDKKFKWDIIKDIALLAVLIIGAILCFNSNQSAFIKIFYTVVSSMGISVFGIYPFIERYKSKKALKGIKISNIFLENEIEDCKSKIKDLEQKKSYAIVKESQYENKIVDIVDNNYKNLINNVNNLYYNTGYSADNIDFDSLKNKIMDIYNNSNVDDKSFQSKTNSDIEAIKKYLKKK